MLSKSDEDFLLYWEKNRDKEKKLMYRLFISLPLGLLISGGILFSLDLNWYQRANMVANSQTNPLVLLIAVVAIAVFTAIFYKKFKWDMNEQHYKELVHKKQQQTTEANNAAK
jgi:predicted ABC-type exoprotein transport system permease subunit